jgi:hypothetical protein
METRDQQCRLWPISFICAVLLPVSAWAANVTVDCSGATPGAFTSLQAAINSLDVVGPHQITLAPQTCQENVQIVNHQRLTITAAPTGALISSAAGATGDVMTVSGSSGITFIQVGFRGGNRGVFIALNSEVAIHGTTIEMNAGAGVRIERNSTVTLDGLIQNNGGPGVNAYGSTVITGGGTHFLNNGGAGISMHRSRGTIHANTIQGNNSGVYLENGSAVEFDAPTAIQNNAGGGVFVNEGSSAQFFGSVDSTGAAVPNTISDNPIVGLYIYSATVSLHGPNVISNNGSLAFLHAGVRADLNASLIVYGPGVEITGNTGPGIEATTGGNVLLTDTVISKNSGDGVRLRGNGRVVMLPPNTNNLTGNGGQRINCDETSVFVGDPTGFGEIECSVVPPSNL